MVELFWTVLGWAAAIILVIMILFWAVAAAIEWLIVNVLDHNA